jgi:hypothetical protein
MATRLNQSEVYDYWTKQAYDHGQSPSASWSDHPVIEMEIAEIAKHLTWVAPTDTLRSNSPAPAESSFEVWTMFPK